MLADLARLTIGSTTSGAGEKRYGRANFRELYAVFDSPRMLSVRYNTQEIGTVEARFLRALTADAEVESPTFTLGGKAWQVVHTEWERGICAVRPAPEGRAARWMGGARWLSREMAQAIRRVYTNENEDPAWSKRARTVLGTARAEHEFLQATGSSLVPRKGTIEWWTFAGGAANVLLALTLEQQLGGRVTADNLKLTFRGEAGASDVRAREAIVALRDGGRLSDEDAARLFKPGPSARLSKFAPCLPEAVQQELGAREAFDVAGARVALGEACVVVGDG